MTKTSKSYDGEFWFLMVFLFSVLGIVTIVVVIQQALINNYVENSRIKNPAYVNQLMSDCIDGFTNTQNRNPHSSPEGIERFCKNKTYDILKFEEESVIFRKYKK